jgi:ribonuclease J
MLSVVSLGGLGEIGLNMMVMKYGHDVLVVDVGLMFPDKNMPGVDIVIPDFSSLMEQRDNVRGIILTHGHEDHIGGIPFLLKELKVPVFGTNFTIEILREKLREHDLLEETVLNKVAPGDVTELGSFRVEYIHVNHSIIDGVGLAIKTPDGVIIHSGDFKVDHTPVHGKTTDLARFSQYGEEGVLALFSDSTNVEKEGFTPSETEVKNALEDLFLKSTGRLVVAVFASNIARIQQIINLAEKYGRKVVLSGKSMRSNVRIAMVEGLLNMPEGIEINENVLSQHKDNQIAIITTGSQGEPMSVLARIARNTHKSIKVNRGDTIILSSRFIPGNEKAITAIINRLYRLGAEVVYEKVSDIHTSGHAYKEELKLMLNLVKPCWFVPVHGEYRHLVKHAQMAVSQVGISQDRCLLAENGDIISFKDGKARISGKIRTGRILVDGKGGGDEDDLVLRDRRKISREGIVIVLLVVDKEAGRVVYGPDIVSRGFLFDDKVKSIEEDAKGIVFEVLEEASDLAQVDWEGFLVPEIKKRLKRFFYKVIERNPLILPMVIPV